MARNEYVLHIDIENIQSSKSKAKEKLENVSGKGGPDKGKQDKINKAVKVMTKKVAISAVNDIAKPIVDFQINSYSARYGNTARANAVKNIQNIVGRIEELNNSILQGAMVGGGYGAAIMGAMDIAKQAVEMVYEYKAFESTQEVHKFEEIRASERLGLQLSDRNRGK